MGKDILFLQFAQEDSHDNTLLNLNNGLSNVYNECKKIGDFYWATQFNNQSEMGKNELPIKKGKVYVSAFYYPHLLQTYYWAQKYPDIEFNVGGPVIRSGNYSGQDLPVNLNLTNKNAEEVILNKNTLSKTWGIEYPKEYIKGKKAVRFTYHLDHRCYWNKCIFCEGYTKDLNKGLNNSIDNLKINDNYSNLKKIIRLNIPSITPKFLKYELPRLLRRKDIVYDFFLRASKEIIDLLPEVLKNLEEGNGPHPSQLRFVVGVEFPSYKMLQYMKKGIEKDIILRIIELAKDYHISLGLPFIYGWNNLSQTDVDEAVEFLHNVEKIGHPNTESVLFKLEVYPNTSLFSSLKGCLEPLKKYIFDNGEHRVVLNAEQYLLNEEFKNALINSRLNTVLYDSTKLGYIYTND
ncbi:hypothetical protein REC12_14795 [Desulfosporosinus sp. PR]|uniref:hypothetical protein n=1 Tax=Candidatus Desulfosporosinus nitrosoreducens TaxID=3401928 RepID=UPI0027FD1AB8|nr:hypothetical protein [Desulfosporosinus sp. PR]MDQ7094864.1 hypothetical protein [Desulfosporosinus sp. PR]